MTETPEYAIEATDTSLTILETLVESGSLGVTALADEVGIAKSAVHNHLTTLRAHGYVTKRDGTYEPSLGMLALGERARASLDVADARPKVDNLAQATGETTFLVVEEDGWGVPVYVSTTDESWEPPLFEGERIPLHANAAGKAILSSLPQERVDDVLAGEELAAPTERTITDPAELRDQLAGIRDDGIAFSKEEQFDGIVGVAAPLPRTTGARPAAIGVAGSVETLHGRHLEEDITGQVLSTAKAVHVELTSS